MWRIITQLWRVVTTRVAGRGRTLQDDASDDCALPWHVDGGVEGRRSLQTLQHPTLPAEPRRTHQLADPRHVRTALLFPPSPSLSHTLYPSFCPFSHPSFSSSPSLFPVPFLHVSLSFPLSLSRSPFLRILSHPPPPLFLFLYISPLLFLYPVLSLPPFKSPSPPNFSTPTSPP